MNRRILHVCVLLVALLGFSVGAHAQFVAYSQAAQHHGSGLSLNPGWTQGQDTFLNVSCGTTTTCTSGDAYYPLPLTAGSARVLAVECGGTGSGSTRTITSASINSVALTTNSSWVASLGQGDEYAAAYGIGSGGTGGNLSISATMSGTCNNMTMVLTELIPPSGYTASFDQFTTATSASCTTCSGGAFSGGSALTATDAIIQYAEQEYVSPVTWNSISAPYLGTDILDAIYLNAPSGTLSAPTFTMQGAHPFTSIGMAFKATAGSFSVPTPVFTLVNHGTVSGTGAQLTCTPTCSFPVPGSGSTGAADLLFLMFANSSGVNVSSVSGGGTWVVPTSCQQLLTQSSTNYQLSCAFVLSSTSGTSSLSITMESNASPGVAYWEVSRTGGSFVLDQTTKGTLAASFTPQIGSLPTLSGTNDVIFHALMAPGGIGGVTMDIQAGDPNGMFIWLGQTGAGILLNTTNVNGPFWVYQDDFTTGYFSVAFK